MNNSKNENSYIPRSAHPACAPSTRRRWLAGLGALIGFLAPATAAAQLDINPPLPNVMLLVDSSGSMERMADGSLPKCDPNGANSEMNRWATLVSVMTGTVNKFGCQPMERNSARFLSQYQHLGAPPPDAKYFLPHHRIVSDGCVMTPGSMAGNAFDWPANAFVSRPYNDPNGNCASSFTGQQTDGLLDVYKQRVRFGFMTFDSHPDPSVGVSGTTGTSDGASGSWSYFNNWQTGGTPSNGFPPNCSVSDVEVGVRNAAAPPWEGRMIAFGQPSAAIGAIETNNERIQQALYAVRPYGGTPLEGMLADAYTFFAEDQSDDPLASGQPFAAARDPFFLGGCRKSIILLLSDGEPNLDLRPHCEQAGGDCPYKRAWEYAYELANPPNSSQKVETYTIGFGLSSADDGNGNTIDCGKLDMPVDIQAGGICDGAKGTLKACCTLSRIAYEGGGGRAYFADDQATLRNAISAVLAGVAASSTSRTLPAISGGAAAGATGNAPAVSYEFNSSFAPEPTSLWGGNLERKRWECVTRNGALVPELQDIDSAKGDDFAENVNQGKLAQPRRFLTVVADGLQNSGTSSQQTIRPNLGNDEGMGAVGGSLIDGGTVAIANAMKNVPEAMRMSPIPPACLTSLVGAVTAGDCAYRVMNWELGGSNGSVFPSRAGNEFGAIYHATPVVHGTPSAFVRDPSYERYANLAAQRPLMLYTATTDGQLHAFKIAPNDPQDTQKVDQLSNNELWSFMPPHVLPGLLSQYPATQQILLDGVPVVRDVVYERTSGADPNAVKWSSVLVAGGRGGGGFYYALDVTEPNNPKFLWQLSSNDKGEKLFSDVTARPAITTIALPGGVNGVTEVAVAILPGGAGLKTANCSAPRPSNNFAHIDSGYTPRSNVGCWQAGPSRGLSIVRLDTGEIIRHFAGASGDFPATLDPGIVTTVGFNAPMSGVPVPFPNQTGQISNRIYIGDQDGSMWRIDLSNPEPAQWDMQLAFDAYSMSGDNAEDGEPIATAPVVSVDDFGNTILLFSTGDQESFANGAKMKTRVWSITEFAEKAGAATFRTEANWVIPFAGGKRVTGPIALFDGVAYFSTFTPATGNTAACEDGFGSIWGVDYVESYAGAQGPLPTARLPVDPNANPIVYVDEDPQPGGIVVFGVTVAAEPACTETSSVTNSFVGKHTTLSQSVPPVFKLIFQTGAGGQATGNAKTKTSARALSQPRSSTSIDSWAGVVE